MQDPRGPARARGEGEPIEAVIIHPPVRKAFVSSEHPEGELDWLGDALGMDFIVVRFVDGWMRPYKGDGKKNSDWFGWSEDVLAPCDGVVRLVTESADTNTPGSHSGGRASGLVFERDDGVMIGYGHVKDVCVKVGDRVSAGQVVGKVGNDGHSWHPHVHVGAWLGDTPLQIRVDLAAKGRLRAEQGEAVYYGINNLATHEE